MLAVQGAPERMLDMGEVSNSKLSVLMGEKIVIVLELLPFNTVRLTIIPLQPGMS